MTTTITEKPTPFDEFLAALAPAQTTPEPTDLSELLSEMVTALLYDDKLLDIPDIRRAMTLLDKTRIQNRFDVGNGNDQCRYADPATNLPDCIAGTVIALLAPTYFSVVSERASSVDNLPQIGNVFTQRAIQLLRQMQIYADSLLPWGEAYLRAQLDLHVAD